MTRLGLLMSLLSCVANWESDPPESILDWVEENVYFSEAQGQVPGYWSHARFPYSAGPIQAMADEDCREVVLRWGTQLGKTTAVGAYVAWKADQSPSPVLILCPSQQVANENYDQKLNPVLLQCASIESKRPPIHRRNKETVDLGRMMLYYAWAGSTGTVSSRTIPCILVNEAGLITTKGKHEGDRIAMARDRAKGYSQWRRKVIIEGKCTIEGECQVTRAYEQTDQRTYHVPCPHCGQYQELILGEKDAPGLQFDPNDLVNKPVWYRCVNGCRIDEAVKTLMYRRGLWVRKGERIAKGESAQTHYLKQEIPTGYCIEGEAENPTDKAGFHLTSLYSGALTWSEFAEAFVSAKRGGRSTLKAFVQSWLAKPFADVSHRITFAVLRAHCLDYKIGTVPSYHATLMMTTDVQSDGFYWLVRAWSYRATSWLIKYGFVESWPELARAEQQVFNGINDDKFVIHRNWIDSGDGKRTEEVYYECAKRRGFRRPLKGVWQYRGGSMVSPLKIQHRGLRGWNIDSAQAFDHLFGVRMEIPAGQPGHWGLPSDIDTDYLRSIATWKRREEKKDGREIKYWKASDESIEHYGDLEKYQVAAAAQMNFEFLEPPAANASRSERGRFVDQYGRPFLVTER